MSAAPPGTAREPGHAVTVCVYCASSRQADERLRRLAAETGRALAGRGWHMVYGGGGIGLMGEAARAAMAAGGRVTGVIPERLTSREVAAPDITELRVVATMRQRKHLMDSLADAFLVLPGGIGTLEEFLEIITLRQLGYHDRPVVLLDPDGFWAPLRRQFADMVTTALAPASVTDLFAVATDVTAALDTIAGRAAPGTGGGDWDAALG